MQIKLLSFLLCLFLQTTLTMHSARLSTSHQLRNQQQHLEPSLSGHQSADILGVIRAISFDQSQKSIILAFLAQKKQQINGLQKTSALLPNEPQFQRLASYFTRQEKFLQQLENSITANSESLTHHQATYQSNIFAKSWILGKHTIEDLLKKYNSQASGVQLKNKCPLETPFYDGKRCIKCEKDLPVFNIFTSKCQKCPQDTQINNDKHVCQQITHFSDYKNIQNYALEGLKSLPVSDSNLTPCPVHHPYFDGKCVQCKLPKYWSAKENKCKQCPKSQVFDLKAKICKIPMATNLDYLATSQLYIQVGNYTLQNLNSAHAKLGHPTVNCPKETPIWNGTDCVGCPKGQHYYLNNFSCYKPQKASNYKAIEDAKNFIEVDGFTIQKMQASLKQKKLPVTKCPTHSPLFDGRTCVKCSEGLYYNLKTQKCVTLTVVQPKITYTTNVDAIKLQNNYLEIEVATLENIRLALSKIPEPKTQCPKDTPLFDGKKCISCKSKLYNFKNLKCDECPNGLFFNEKSRTCKVIYLPNLSGKKWMVNSYKGFEDVHKLVRQRAALKRPVFCPEDKPHFNNKTKECQSCAADAYWNYETLVCTRCPLKYVLNSKTHRCQSKDPNHPQLQEFTD